MNFFDNLVVQVFEKYNLLNKSENDIFDIVAGIVMEDQARGFTECISIGSGTKSTSYNNIAIDGSTLNDCHAEVLARRGFILYLYEQIKLCKDQKRSILEYNNNEYIVKSNIKFHFVTSESLCGDASIITSYDELEEDEKPKKEIEHIGEFGRTGAKLLNESDGENHYLEDLANNGLPVRKVQKTGKIRRKPGKGIPSYSMSCSDKIVRWCILGVQGLLLSHFIKRPLVFESIVIARCKRSLVAVNRAITSRLNIMNSLLKSHNISPSNIPTIYFSSISFNSSKNIEINASSKGTVWVSGEKEIKEVIIRGYRQGFTKKAKNSVKQSSLSKLNLLAKFINLYQNGNENIVLTYRKCKERCLFSNYEYSKKEAIFFAVYSTWIRTNTSEFYSFVANT